MIGTRNSKLGAEYRLPAGSRTTCYVAQRVFCDDYGPTRLDVTPTLAMTQLDFSFAIP